MFSTSIPKALQMDKAVTFHRGAPTPEILENVDMNDQTFTLLVIDDLLETAYGSSDVSTIFTQVSFFKITRVPAGAYKRLKHIFFYIFK